MSHAPDRISMLSEKLRRFVIARNWERYHSPKNLSMALAGEAAEIMELFQWMTEEESRSLDAQTRAMLADEIGDVFIYLLMLADKAGLDVTTCAEEKLEKNRKKYPANSGADESGVFTEFG